MEISLRDSTVGDLKFVFTLNKINMRKYVETIRVWNDEKELADMREKFTPGVDKIIQYESKDIGVLRVVDEETHIKIDHIELLPEFQGRGIGTKLIQDILKKNTDKDVTLSVFKGNPAKKLYEDLGFVVTGKNNTKYFMKKEAQLIGSNTDQ